MLKDFVSIYVFVAVSVPPTSFSSLASIAGKERLLSALSTNLSESNAMTTSKEHSEAPGKVVAGGGELAAPVACQMLSRRCKKIARGKGGIKKQRWEVAPAERAASISISSTGW